MCNVEHVRAFCPLRAGRPSAGRAVVRPVRSAPARSRIGGALLQQPGADGGCGIEIEEVFVVRVQWLHPLVLAVIVDGLQRLPDSDWARLMHLLLHLMLDMMHPLMDLLLHLMLLHLILHLLLGLSELRLQDGRNFWSRRRRLLLQMIKGLVRILGRRSIPRCENHRNKSGRRRRRMKSLRPRHDLARWPLQKQARQDHGVPESSTVRASDIPETALLKLMMHVLHQAVLVDARVTAEQGIRPQI